MDISEIKQLELLKKKAPVERFRLMTRLIQNQLEAMQAGIRHEHPDISEKELRKCLKTRMNRIYSLKH